MVLNFFGVGVVKQNSCQMINWSGCVSSEVQQYSEVKSCCPQAGRWVNEKDEFHELMTRLWQVRRCWWVVTLMAMLVVIWVVLERLMGVWDWANKWWRKRLLERQLAKGCAWWILVSRKGNVGLWHLDWVKLKQWSITFLGIAGIEVVSRMF